MNVIWVVADTFRRDHLGAYGNDFIRTLVLDGLAAEGTLFNRRYAGGFPTMPTRADHATGRWTMSFMGWEPLPEEVRTLAEILAARQSRGSGSLMHGRNIWKRYDAEYSSQQSRKS